MRGGDAVEISGRREASNISGRESVTSEIRSGEFRRVIDLPSFVEIAVEQVSATMEDGVLKVRLPRRDAAQRRTVEIL
jgi:HSP20 family molecular chaperone IbpA